MKLPVRYERKHLILVDADGKGLCVCYDDLTGEMLARVINSHNQLVASLERAIFEHGAPVMDVIDGLTVPTWAAVGAAAISASGRI